MNIVRSHNGMECVWRAGRLWRRPTPTSAWSAGATTGADSGLLLRDPADDTLCLLGDSLRYSHDHGLSTNTTPGPTQPATVASWAAAGLTLTDAHLWPDGLAVAIGIGLWRPASGWDPPLYALYVLGMDGSLATRILGYTGSVDELGAPVLFRDTTRQLLAFRRAVAARADGVLAWTNVDDGAGDWTALYEPGSVTYPDLVRACGWEGFDGRRIVAGYSPEAGQVRAVYRGSGWWLETSLAVSVAAAVEPYVVETTGGGFEVGWHDGTGWQRWVCVSVAGAWTHTEGA